MLIGYWMFNTISTVLQPYNSVGEIDFYELFHKKLKYIKKYTEKKNHLHSCINTIKSNEKI